ncbi:MAG: putative Histidine kinase [Patescibacteria group bacterium]|nr:putative Histidine kinase [Patescibacteria group bacterium]
MFRSAIAKLTLSYLGIIMVLSLLFSFALYRESSNQLIETANRQHNAVNRFALPIGFNAQRDAYSQLIDDQLAAAQHQLQIRLLILDLATLMIGGGASYFLARRTLRPIQNAMEAQGRFTADASHELRTPLTAMRTEIEVALRGKELTPKEARELLQSNLEEIAKLESLSAGLLRLAQFERGIAPDALAKVPVKDIFAEAAARFQPQLKARDITLQQTAGAHTIEGDRASLTELVAILLDNAIKYSPPKSEVSLRGAKNGNFVSLSVTDHGVGMKASDIPYIFNRFYRADRSRSKEQIHGYGLGLSIAKRIADLHHGAVTVTSAPGKGSTFTVKLPAEYEDKKSLLG